MNDRGLSIPNLEPEDSSNGQRANSSSGNLLDESQQAVKSKPDLFANINNLRVSQDFTANGGGSTRRLQINHRKPGPSTFFRTHSEFQMLVGALELKDQGSGVYLVLPALCEAVADIAGSCYSIRSIIPWINRQNEISLWAIKMPDPNGRSNDWTASALEAVNIAMTSWIKIVANMRQGRYDFFDAEVQGAEPDWPDINFADMLRMAFRSMVIDSLDHPILKTLQGRE